MSLSWAERQRPDKELQIDGLPSLAGPLQLRGKNLKDKKESGFLKGFCLTCGASSGAHSSRVVVQALPFGSSEWEGY